MKIFLSYASQDRIAAQSIHRALLELGHDVFFDREDLSAGEEFHIRIRRAIERSDLFVFLVSDHAIDPGSYTLTELDIAARSLRRASGRFLPVMLAPVSLERLPEFVKSVTLLQPSGSVTADVADAVHRIARKHRRSMLWKLAASTAGATVVVAGTWWYIDRNGTSTELTGRDRAPAVRIPAGNFVMGDEEQSPLREIYLDEFFIDKFEVTTERYAKFLAETGSVAPPDGWETVDGEFGALLPVVGVSWHDADAYCRWAGRRLPTESEWEKAARGSDERIFPWGNELPTPDRANYANSDPDPYRGGLDSVGSHPTGRSPYGVDGLVGNVSEWTADWYSESFPVGDVRNPRGPETGTKRVIRGSSRHDSGDRLLVTKRWFASPEERNDEIGFRCAQDADKR